MRSLQPPAFDSAQYFDAISAAKQNPNRARLLMLRETILGEYADYDEEAPEFDGIVGINCSPAQKQALLHAYTSETAPLRELRGNLFAPLATTKCPLCALNEASTLDHYLPKEDFPQFSVHVSNLVPACGRCNTIKLRKTVDEGTDIRLFIHPYFDQVPTQSFLQLDVELHEDSIDLTFSLCRPPTLGARAFEHLQNHFELLDLANRYRRFALDELRGMLLAIRQYYNPDQNAQRVSDYLAREANSQADAFGPNHWRAVLCDALAQHGEFCDAGFEVMAPP